MNINPDTGVRYGVVSLNNLCDWVFEEFIHHGVNESEKEAVREYLKENPDDPDLNDFYYESEEDTLTLETTVKDSSGNECRLNLMLTYLGGAPLVWVLDSPCTALARLCSSFLHEAFNGLITKSGFKPEELDGRFKLHATDKSLISEIQHYLKG